MLHNYERAVEVLISWEKTVSRTKNESERIDTNWISPYGRILTLKDLRKRQIPLNITLGN